MSTSHPQHTHILIEIQKQPGSTYPLSLMTISLPQLSSTKTQSPTSSSSSSNRPFPHINEGMASLRGLEKCNKKPFCECSHLWDFKRTSCKQDGGEQILPHSSNTPTSLKIHFHFALPSFFLSHFALRPKSYLSRFHNYSLGINSPQIELVQNRKSALCFSTLLIDMFNKKCLLDLFF